MKKILLITYYWPPAGGIAVRRWLKLLKYLILYDLQATVITTKDGDYPVRDEKLLKEVPKNIRVIRTYTPSLSRLVKKVAGNSNKIPYGSLKTTSQNSFFEKLMIFVRLNFVIPDMRIVWNLFAWKKAKKELIINKYDLIISTGPPHSTHLIADKLARKFSIKWIADFRDPWTQMGYLQNVKRSVFSSYCDEILEKRIVKNSDIILAASKKIKHDFKDLGKITVITNGFDEDDFSGYVKKRNSVFSLAHFGTLAPETDPTSILLALNQLYEKGKNKIRFDLWGNVSEEIEKKLQRQDRFNLLNIKGHIDHETVLTEMINSNLLLLIIIRVKNNCGILTGKLFEYLGAQNPILGIGPKDGEAAAILKETNSGEMFFYDEITAIEDYIGFYYKLWLEQKQWKPTAEKYWKYSHKYLAKKVFQIIKKTI